jgi:4-hydroxybenzoyl-CoA thioesterase
MDSTATAFESSKPIRFHHCDPAGIVFYPEYFVLFNEFVEDWFNEGLGVNFARYHIAERLGVPTVRVECDFLEPSQVGDMLRLRLSVRKIGTSSLTLAIEAGVGDAVRVRATLVIVQASLDTLRAVPFSPEFRAKLARYQR